MSWVLERAKRRIRKLLLFPTLYDLIRETNRKLIEIQELKDLILYHQTKQLQYTHPNPLNRFGKKCFSQTDEDGIVMEILKRIGIIANGVYAEFGVGTGLVALPLINRTLGRCC